MITPERIRPCTECGRTTRPSNARAAEHPGTVVRGNRDLCVTCYSDHRTTVGDRAGALYVPASIVLASVPDPAHAQQADCRPSCCRTPYMCARQYRCSCHRMRR